MLDVCPKKGCRVSLELENGEKAFVKMKDYGFFVPVAAIGKTVVIDGEVKMKTTSVAELKHYAEDAKKPQAELMRSHNLKRSACAGYRHRGCGIIIAKYL